MISLRPSPASRQELKKRLDAIRALARPQPDLVKVVQRAIVAEFANNLRDESASGTRWARLAESTIRDRLQQGYGPGPILQRSGDYADSWTYPDSPNHVHEVTGRVEGWAINEGSQHELAQYHEPGTGRMAARPVSEIGPDGQNRIKEDIDRWLFQTLFVR